MKVYSNEIAQDVRAVLCGERIQKTLQSIIKTGEKNGTFEAVASTDDLDRHGEKVVQEGIDASNWNKNPVILYGHNSWNLPIGMGTRIWTEKKGKSVITKVSGVFAGHKEAQEVRELYDMGFSAMSIGFIQKEYDDEKKVIQKSELLEASFVAIPANPKAVKELVEKGFDVKKYVEKGLIKATDPVAEKDLEEKEDEEKKDLEQVERMLVEKGIEGEENEDEENEDEKEKEKKKEKKNEKDHEEQVVKSIIGGALEDIKKTMVSKEDLNALSERIGVLESGVEKLVNAGLEDSKEVKEEIGKEYNRKRIQNAVSNLSGVLQDLK